MWCRVNVSTGPREDRILLTGLHTVADISCNDCHSVVGWKYVRATATAPATGHTNTALT